MLLTFGIVLLAACSNTTSGSIQVNQPDKSVDDPVPLESFSALETILTSNDIAAEDIFGESVAISGSNAIVGAPRDDDNGDSSGSAYIFTNSGTTWNQQAKLTANDGEAGDFFGPSVAISGNTAVIGNPRDDDNGINSGAVYIFTRSGTTWNQQAKLIAGDGSVGDEFGNPVAIDGDTVIVGAWQNDTKGIDSGAAYIFTRSGTTWNQQAKLTASDGVERDAFGFSVAISGNTVTVGANRKSNSVGAAYVFTQSGTIWNQQAKVIASDGANFDGFGNSIAISGNTLIVGASDDDVNTGTGEIIDLGSAYIFTRSGTSWNQQAKLNVSNLAYYFRFGDSVAISGDTVIVGANGEGINVGSAYVFTLSGTSWTQQLTLTASDGEDYDFLEIQFL